VLKKKFYLKERHNPQLGIYYVRCGQLSETAAKRKERGGVYGSNVMLPYDTEIEYAEAIAKLAMEGKSVQ